MELAPNGHEVLFIEEMFPNVDTREFSGTVTVTTTQGKLVVGAIQLGSGQGQMVSWPAIILR